MPALTHHPAGTISWVDLTTPDIEGARAFYTDLLGWEVQRSDTPDGVYYVAEVCDAEVAGLMAQTPAVAGLHVPPEWTVYVRVEEIEAAVAAVEKAGGSVIQAPTSIPGDSRMAVVSDPTGASFALFEHADGLGIELWGEPGALILCEELTRDPLAAALFYEAALGWKAETSEMAGTPYTLFRVDGTEVAGMMPMPPPVPAEAPSHWMVAFAAADCAAAATRAVSLGGRVLVAPTAERRFAVLEDPQGGVFAIMEPAAA